MKIPAFLGGSGIAQSPAAVNARTMNFYPELLKTPGGKSQIQLYPTPGVTQAALSGYSPARGSFAQNGRCFWAMGTQLQELSTSSTLTSLGDIAYSDTLPVSMVANGDAGDQLFAVASGVAYLLNLTTNALSTPAVEGSPVMAAYLDGYFLYLDDASRLFHSTLFDGTAWDATDVAARSAAPDPWQAVHVNKSNKTLCLFGEETTEFWYNAGLSPYPFAPIPGALIPYGILAPFSVKQVGGAVMFLGRTSSGQGDVIMLEGLQPRPIGDQQLHAALASYDTLDDAVADTYEELGHVFYELSFPSGITWVYDLTTGLWHERGTWLGDRYIAKRTQNHAFFNGTHYVGDRETGVIYRQSVDLREDVDSLAIRRLRQGPSISHENKRIFYDSFELLAEMGLAELGETDYVTLQMSNDGGKTWGNELPRSMGARGDYGARMQWKRLGSARDRQFRIVTTAPARLIDAFIEAHPGVEIAA
jgi:hypothetical protein